MVSVNKKKKEQSNVQEGKEGKKQERHDNQMKKIDRQKNNFLYIYMSGWIMSPFSLYFAES
jgi:hypothetical protein